MIRGSRSGATSLKLLIITGFVFNAVVVLEANSDSKATLSNESSYRASELRMMPLSYDVKLKFLPSNFSFDGESSVILEIYYPLKVISMHADRLKIDTITLIKCNLEINKKNKNEIWYKTPYEVQYHNESQYIDIFFVSDLSAGCYKLNMTFKGQLNSEEGDFNLLNRKEIFGEGRYFIVMDFYRTGARRFFPCWDELSFKAAFKLSILHYPAYKVLSNTPGKETLRTAYRTLTVFEETPPIVASQLAIVMTDLITVNDKDGIVDVWCRQSIRHQVKFAQNIAKLIWREMNLYINRTPYFKVLNIIVQPEGNRIMQTWGLIIFSEQHIVCNDEDSDNRKFEVALTVARQIIHQCFGNVIFPSWLTQGWLNEALTTYFQYIILDQIRPEWRVMDLFVVKYHQFSLARETENPHIDNFMSIDNSSVTPIEKFFYFPSYSKATFLMHMLRYAFIEGGFRNGLNEYLDKYQASSTSQLFWDILQKQVGYNILHSVKLEKVMHNWLMQANYPIVHIERNYDDNTILLRQTPAKRIKTNKNDWWIPIIYTTQTDIDFRITATTNWIRNGVLWIHGINQYDWILFNLQQSGYYRVKYDMTNLQRIINYLNSDQYTDIHSLNRAQIIDDTYYFLLNDQLNPNLFFELMKYLKWEIDFVPWYSMNKVFEKLWYFYQYPQGKFLKLQVPRLLKGLVENVKRTKNYKNTIDNDMRLSFVKRWTCYFDNDECKEKATRTLQSHIADSRGTRKNWQLSPSSQKLLYCTGLMKADIITWHRIFDEYMSTKEETLLEYLACTDNEVIVMYYLQKLANSKILEYKSLQRTYISIAKKHAKSDAVLQFLISNLMKLTTKIMDEENILSIIIENLYSPEYIDKVTDYVTYHKINITKSRFESMMKKQRNYIKDEMDKYAYFFNASLWDMID